MNFKEVGNSWLLRLVLLTTEIEAFEEQCSAQYIGLVTATQNLMNL